MLSYLKFINESLIKEGSSSKPSYIYWNEQLKDIIDKDWNEISVSRHSSDKYCINFKVGDDKYDYYSVIVDSKDNYYLESTEQFIKKFIKEFWKNATLYVKNMKYNPKCLGDLQHVKDSEKYNL